MTGEEKWWSDLDQGNKGERVIADYITKKKPEYKIAYYRNDKWYDFRMTGDTVEDKTFEVKTDCFEKLKGYYTNNMFIEIKCNGRDSGITSSKADYFVYYFPYHELAYFVEMDKIREFFNTDEKRTGIRLATQSGDGGRVTGYVVDRHKWKSIFNVVKIKKDKNIWSD